MGEQKRREAAMTPRDQVLQRLSRELTDEGRLIEAGWTILQSRMLPPDAPEGQLREMRLAYVAGAQHLWASIMTILEAGSEATSADLERMSKIDTELEALAQELELRIAAPKGSG